MLSLYTIFHLNLAFSSIPEEQRPEVIRRCYWPLLRLARKLDLPFGIEITGYTLETVAAIDPAWVAELRELCAGRCELVGSGYSQLIGPLVPAAVTRHNLRLGNLSYQTLLGVKPAVALVNEQAYSAGLIGHYLEAGYRAIVMEWDNPASLHHEWNREWRYHPQIALGQHGEEIPVIWNNSIYFQKFQRYAHGELELDEYLKLIARHDDGTPRAFPLYGNDIEIFDFRPGRFTTEAVLAGDEWERIGRLFERVLADPHFRFVPPSELLPMLELPGGGNRLHLESAEVPVPVKKQEKYNITRWAVTGRDDVGVNTLCRRIHDRLISRPDATDAEWRELCYLWSSDFRTHITSRRWRSFRGRLDRFARRCGVDAPVAPPESQPAQALPPGIVVHQDRRHLSIETPKLKVALNLRRGLAVESLVFPEISAESLCGTLPHGYFDDIGTGADFYTGHVVFETMGRPKVTDLGPVDPVVGWDPERGEITVTAKVATPLGDIEKRYGLGTREGALTLTYRFHWKALPVGSLRIGNVTLNPEAFDPKELFYRTHNGGTQPETFPVEGKRISHGDTTSFLVSARHGFGATEGIVEIGDGTKTLRVQFDPSHAVLMGMIAAKPVRPSYFFRCSFSASEMDETSRKRNLSQPLTCHLIISAVRTQ